MTLDSGVSIDKSLKLAAGKTGDPRSRAAMEEVSQRIKRGDDLSTAMRAQGHTFPELMTDMVEVAEKTGALPEVLRSLSGHFENNIRLRRTFYQSIAWPMFQLVAAILVVAGLIFVLGMIAEASGGEALDILFGLKGASGAFAWLTLTFGSMLAVVVGYKVISSALTGKRFLDSLLMRLPVVGGCMQSFALARFSWAFALTQQAGMPIQDSLDASLRATSNGAFIGVGPRLWAMVKAGDPLSVAFAQVGVFPADFVHMVDVAETSGTVPEALERLSPEFEEDARRKLAVLTAALGWAIWMMVAIFIIVLIFNIITKAYLNPLNEALEEAL
jgi:type IV pilus assembly protein PilC